MTKIFKENDFSFNNNNSYNKKINIISIIFGLLILFITSKIFYLF
jgi:hypothetical protein